MEDNLEELQNSDDETSTTGKESSKDKKARKKEEKRLKKELKKDNKKADRNNEAFDDDNEKAGGKLAAVLAVLGLVIIWLMIFAMLIKWDIGGFGSNVLTPILKDVPYVNKILPDSDSGDKKETTVNPDYPYKTVEEAIEQIKKLEVELQDAKEAGETESSTVEDLQAEVTRLQEFEKNQVEFQNLKTEFYEEVVFGENAPDISEYQKYYESIDPTNAELLYKQVVAQEAYDQEVQDYATTYSAMKPKQAAAILEELTDNLELVAQILEVMDKESRGDVLGAMNPEFAAKLTKIMAPEE